MWISILAFVPACALGGFLCSLGAPGLVAAVFMWCGLMVIANVSAFRTTDFVCPHCREPFAKRSATPVTPSWFVRCCVHCGIRVGTPRSAVVAALAAADGARDGLVLPAPRTWSIQMASDVIRDGLGVELLDATRAVRAEVFRCDADHTVTVSHFGGGEAPPADVVEWYYAEAARRLDRFEDDSPLPERSAWRGQKYG